MTGILSIIWMVVAGIGASQIAESKHRDPGRWCFLGALTPLAMIVVGLLPRLPDHAYLEQDLWAR
jgi:hypothetical protein